jgi:hypothetical protein
MRQAHMVSRPELSDVTAFLANHPRVVVTIALFVVLLASQGTVSAELSLAEPSGSHAASTGP